MADITIKKDDTRPVIQRYLIQNLDGATSPVNLTTASAVTFIMKTGAANPVTGVASIVTAASGCVAYKWATGDTASSGLYDAEWEVAWADGGYETVPNDGYFSIEVVADLGGTV
jgi:hypothetical protein